ncbi:MAG TPA: hypothetical protein VNV15_04615 [Opitutaceae bacterium]|nr:hypothetical protein [Opitutaceae bacterium]
MSSFHSSSFFNSRRLWWTALGRLAAQKPPIRSKTKQTTGLFPRAVVLASLLAMGLAPTTGLACACGCGVYDVGTSSMFPKGSGGTVFLENDYQDQNHNWSGTSQAPAANNPDHDIRTDFFTAGLQEMFNRSWGIQVEVPYVSRHFQTTGGATGSDIVSLNWSGLGDIRVEGIYTGFSPDLSTGVTFGLKLPTGDYTHNDSFGDVDRDSEIGTGSTDVLLGGFHRGNLAEHWTWFGQAEADLPVFSRNQYRPGWELDSAAGIYYNGWSLDRLRITPVAQAKFSSRASDRGDNSAHPLASGFQRVLLAPGIEFHLHPVMIYADVERPVYQHFNGNQLASSAQYKLTVSYMF